MSAPQAPQLPNIPPPAHYTAAPRSVMQGQRPIQPKPTRRPLRVLIRLSIVLAVLLVALGVLVAVIQWVFPKPATKTLSPLSLIPGAALQDELTLLVMGLDANGLSRKQRKQEGVDLFKGARTDSMLLVRLSPQNKTISMVSLPRDSKVYIPQNSANLNPEAGIGKLNSAFALGGAELATQVVQYSFGLPVDRFMVVNFEGVHELVDTLDGVDVTVDKRLYYQDHAGGLDIDFQPGPQHLDGRQAEAYLRFRHDALGDIGRLRRQQYFIAALKNQLQSPLVLAKLPQLVSLSQKYTQTNLSGPEILAIANFVRQVPEQNIRMATLPGHVSSHESTSYWIIDPDPAQALLNRLILNRPLVDSNNRVQAQPIKVGILSTSGASTQATQLKATLEAKGYVVSCQQSGNYRLSQLVENSYRLTDQDTRHLREVSGVLSKLRLVFAPANSTYERTACSTSDDYTLILGQDLF